MKTTIKTTTLLSIAALGMALTGCKAKPMAVTPGLADASTRLAVVEHDRRTMSFGDYKVEKIKRGARVSLGLGIGGKGASKSSRKFSFDMSKGDLTMAVECKLSKTSAGMGGLSISDPEQVMCDLNHGDEPWKVIIVGGKKNSASGRLQKGERELQIKSNHGGMFGARGYVIGEDEHQSAVDVGKKSRTVWLANELEDAESLAFAAAAMALMVYEEVS